MKSQYKKFFEKDNNFELLEMANLHPVDTGFDSGILYVSTKQGHHGPRVKFFRNRAGEGNPSASISISSNPEVKEDSIKITKSEINKVSAFIILNYKELLRFWKEGNSWSRQEVNAFFDNLKKVSM